MSKYGKLTLNLFSSVMNPMISWIIILLNRLTIKLANKKPCRRSGRAYDKGERWVKTNHLDKCTRNNNKQDKQNQDYPRRSPETSEATRSARISSNNFTHLRFPPFVRYIIIVLKLLSLCLGYYPHTEIFGLVGTTTFPSHFTSERCTASVPAPWGISCFLLSYFRPIPAHNTAESGDRNT